MRILIVDLDEVLDKEAFEKSLSKEEVERFSQIKIKQRKEQFVIGRALAKEALKQEFGIVPVIGVDPNGALYAKGHDGIHLSLSHTGRFVMVAVDEHPVGVDIEIPRAAELHKMAMKIFDGQEKEVWADLPPHERVDFFYRAWTMKEAIYKLGREPIHSYSGKFEDAYFSIVSTVKFGRCEPSKYLLQKTG